MSELTFTFKDNTVVVNTHEVDGKQLYKAQDLLKGYGYDVVKCKQTLQNFQRSRKKASIQNEYLKIRGGDTKLAGTYLDKRSLLKLAAYVDEDFEEVVYEAFENLSEGKLMKAAIIANRIIISQELKHKRDVAMHKLKDAIKQSGDNDRWAYAKYFDLATKTVTGYVAKSLTNGMCSASEWLERKDEPEAYQVLTYTYEQLAMYIKLGLDYHQCAAAFGVQTSKNEHLLKDPVINQGLSMFGV